jgi:hypothetical protein
MRRPGWLDFPNRFRVLRPLLSRHDVQNGQKIGLGRFVRARPGVQIVLKDLLGEHEDRRILRQDRILS